MANIAVVGDKVGKNGITSSIGQSFVKVNGKLALVVNDPVTDHTALLSNSQHKPNIHMIEGSSFVKINGIPMCVLGSKASCGEPIQATGFASA